MNTCVEKYELTAKEISVLILMKEGFNSSRISEKLEFSQDEVKEHVRNVFTKLKVSNRIQANFKAIKEGIIYL